MQQVYLLCVKVLLCYLQYLGSYYFMGVMVDFVSFVAD